MPSPSPEWPPQNRQNKGSEHDQINHLSRPFTNVSTKYLSGVFIEWTRGRSPFAHQWWLNFPSTAWHLGPSVHTVGDQFCTCICHWLYCSWPSHAVLSSMILHIEGAVKPMCLWVKSRDLMLRTLLVFGFIHPVLVCISLPIPRGKKNR